jgi:uncharacterized protein YjbI with pentapeptide repeats
MTDEQQRQIARINELSAIARTSWLALIAFLAYIGITLLAVEDADFFVPSRQTQLPIVGIAIPTFSFFVFAPLLATALYVYLHIHLLKLWDAIAETPPIVDGRPLGEHLHPWLVNDTMLRIKSRNAVTPRPLGRITDEASNVLVWSFGPLVLTGFWWRSMSAHSEWLTLLVALCLLVSLYVGFTNWWHGVERLRGGWEAPWQARWKKPVGVIVAVGVIAVSWLRTEFELLIDVETPVVGRWIGDRTISTLAPINLSGVDFVQLPPDWREPHTARHAFRETWCSREGVPMEICAQPETAPSAMSDVTKAKRVSWCGSTGVGNISDEKYASDSCEEFFANLDSRFRYAWHAERSTSVANLDQIELSGRDLRRARAPLVSFVGADLVGLRLENAYLVGARLEGANLIQARLNGADLRWAIVESALLRGASLHGANLELAQLKGAQLSAARLDWANLRAAGLEDADLSNAYLRATDLRAARLNSTLLDGARLEGADLRGVEGLANEQLEFAIGNDSTLLPDYVDPVSGEPLRVYNCWGRAPSRFDEMLTAVPWITEADLQTLRSTWPLCGPDNPRRPTGTPLALDAPYPEGHPLANRPD